MRKFLFPLLVGAMVLAVTACSGRLPLEPPTATHTAVPTMTSVPTSTTLPAPPTQILLPTATMPPAPTWTPYVAPTALPEVPTQPAPVTVASDPSSAHFARLEQLNSAYQGGYLSWLQAIGVSCQAVVQARQPEQETSPSGRISVAGLQIDATACHVVWPAIVTTDVTSRVVSKDANEVQYQPDSTNGSTLYTNVTVSGPVTIWADGQNWGQFTSRLGFVSSMVAQATMSVQPTPVAPTAQPTTPPASPTSVPPTSTPVPAVAKASATSGCLSVSQLDATYGIVRDAQGTKNGLLYDGTVLAGAVLKLNSAQVAELTKRGWVIQGSNPTIKSAWSPKGCRPLSQ